MKFMQKTLLALAATGTIAAAPLAAEWPPAVEAIVQQGANVVGRFDAPAGLTGYAVEHQGQALSLYLLPDGKHLMVGRLLDEEGNDLSAAPLEELIYQPLSQEMWKKLQASSWIADGSDSAQRIVYVFADPNCPYCTAFWKSARPWVESAEVQIRHIPVGMLREDSMGKAAALLASKNPADALRKHEQAGRASTLKPLSTIPPEIARQLGQNRELMHRLGASATPAIFYLSETGRLQYFQGAPQADMLEVILGQR